MEIKTVQQNQNNLGGSANTSRRSSGDATGNSNENSAALRSSSVPRSGVVDCHADAARAGDDLIYNLNHWPKLRFKSDNGATAVRAESADGKISVQMISNLQGDNIFLDAGIIKIEAGIISAGKFKPVPSVIKIFSLTPQTNNTTETMAKTEKKKTGKIALATELLKAGKTKAQVAARLVQTFKVAETTAKNTTAWAASMLKKAQAS